MAHFKDLKKIIDALDSDDKATARAELKKLKDQMVGEDNTRYVYGCKNCPLNCVIESGMDVFDTKFCLDVMKSGSADFKQKTVVKGA
jgi:hypothetical protein